MSRRVYLGTKSFLERAVGETAHACRGDLQVARLTAGKGRRAAQSGILNVGWTEYS